MTVHSAAQEFPAVDVLADLGRQIGLPGLKLDAAGCCQLAFDQRWLVTLTYVAAIGRWYLSCPVADAHVALPGTSQKAMLRANFLGSGCAGGCLSLDPDSRPCLHFQFAQSETNAQTLLAGIEALLNQAETWAARLHAGETGQQTTFAHPGCATGALPGGDSPPAWMLTRV